jgi:hypothetical protein
MGSHLFVMAAHLQADGGDRIDQRAANPKLEKSSLPEKLDFLVFDGRPPDLHVVDLAGGGRTFSRFLTVD